ESRSSSRFISQNPYLRMQVGVLSLVGKKTGTARITAGAEMAPALPVFAGKPAPTNHEMCVIYT
ncbi:hypothetical protein, partial [Pseudomonas putida]|uniref:hypothetical protein n=2 Tax=Pseudomonas TaxID=286 RepID=UPI001AB02CE2